MIFIISDKYEIESRNQIALEEGNTGGQRRNSIIETRYSFKRSFLRLAPLLLCRWEIFEKDPRLSERNCHHRVQWLFPKIKVILLFGLVWSRQLYHQAQIVKLKAILERKPINTIFLDILTYTGPGNYDD